DRRDDGLGGIGKRLSDRALPRRPRLDSAAIGCGRRQVSRRPRAWARRRRKLGPAYRGAESAEGYGGGARPGKRGVGGFMGLFTAGGESVIGFSAGSARGSNEEPAPAVRHLGAPGGHGSRLLLRMVRARMVKHVSVPKATDVFVVGGGPAGIAAALAARQHGLEVTVADGCRP